MKIQILSCLLAFLSLLGSSCPPADSDRSENCTSEFIYAYNGVMHQGKRLAVFADSAEIAYLNKLCNQFFNSYPFVTCKAMVQKAGDLSAKEQYVGTGDLKPLCDAAGKL